jgi:hypothetical protein
MSGDYALIVAVLGLGAGIGLSYLLRRWRGAARKNQDAATPVVYANRQQARRAAREKRKRQ